MEPLFPHGDRWGGILGWTPLIPHNGSFKGPERHRNAAARTAQQKSINAILVIWIGGVCFTGRDTFSYFGSKKNTPVPSMNTKRDFKYGGIKNLEDGLSNPNSTYKVQF